MIKRGSGAIITTSGSAIDPINTLGSVGLSMAAARNYGYTLIGASRSEHSIIGSHHPAKTIRMKCVREATFTHCVKLFLSVDRCWRNAVGRV